MSYGGRALIGLGALPGYQTRSNSECHNFNVGVRLRVIRSVVERETAQTIS
jgi:hypothetical protein